MMTHHAFLTLAFKNHCDNTFLTKYYRKFIFASSATARAQRNAILVPAAVTLPSCEMLIQGKVKFN